MPDAITCSPLTFMLSLKKECLIAGYIVIYSLYAYCIYLLFEEVENVVYNI